MPHPESEQSGQAPKNPLADDYRLGIVGAGAMGQGIAQVALQGGLPVLLHDAREGAAPAARNAVIERLGRLAEKGHFRSDELAAMRDRIALAGGLQDFARCDAIIEAISEDLTAKTALFATLEAIVGPHCILASNTSSLLIAAIARSCRRRARVAGMHFFNPVPLMRLVEVVAGPETGANVVAALVTLGKRLGRTPVVARDGPGFIVNFGGRAYATEAMRILHEGVATPAQIDAIMRDCCGFRMGPCELMDLTGIDVNFPVTEVIRDGYDNDPRLRTAFPHRALFISGRFGRKTGAGHFRYDAAGRKIDPPSPDFAVEGALPRAVVGVEADPALSAFAAAIGLDLRSSDDGASPILAAPLGEDCASFAERTGADFRRLVAVDLSCDTGRRATLMTAPGADPAALAGVAKAVALSGRAVTAIKDSPGFVAQRIRAMIANLGCEMAQIGIAAPVELDLAMTLGLNYPLGPLALAAEIGPKRLLDLLQRLQAITGEDRYRPSAWLRRRAQLGLPIHTPA
jgi:3-hydroxybutyryl-CoA dehydrogenase